VIVLSGLGVATGTKSPRREQPRSVIVQGRDLASVRTLVRAVGGTVTHELGVIDAVGARLDPRQARLLREREPGIRFYADRQFEIAATSVSGSSTVRDEFATTSYGNNNGTVRWSSDWLEIGDDGLPYASDGASIVADLDNSRLRIARTGIALSRQVGLLPATSSAVLSFRYRRAGLESGDYVSVQVSANGSTFTEIGRLAGPATDGAYLTASYDITGFRSPTTTVRFVSSFKLESSAYLADAVYLDDVQVAFVVPNSASAYPALSGLPTLHNQGIRGTNVVVAVLDTGMWAHPNLVTGADGGAKVLAQYDATRNVIQSQWGQNVVTSDLSGHGSHVTSLVLNRGKDSQQRFLGVAPDARFVSVKAFDGNGSGRYADVIRAIDWVVANRYTYSIRVLNCSFSAPARSHYWDDPINQALMKAWQAGIVVVVSAGNQGPAPMTIGVPGNLPYVITVGATSDNYTPADAKDDFLGSFSSVGPTAEGFVKPDLAAPGGHDWGLMSASAKIAQTYPQFKSDGDYFAMSGTSQSAGVVSGVVALMLQNKWQSPDDTKCQLLSSARPAITAAGTLAYSVFQQGAGLVNPAAAVQSYARGCGNYGLDIAADLRGERHFGGRANRDANGRYYLMGLSGDGSTWNGSYLSNTGYAWSDGYVWSDGYAWSDGYLWSDGYAWSDGFLWSDGYVWSDGFTETMSTNAWVPQE
jgi:subtilisin family serine protease